MSRPRPAHRQLARCLVTATGLALLVIGLGRPIGPLPPIGPFLDPGHGVWTVARTAVLPHHTTATIPGLEGDVEVVIDRRGVPHVFATSETDAFRAQGYLVARDRLFQLELQTRATAGRLTEWVDSVALPADRSMRMLGLAAQAEGQFAALDSSGREVQALEAYADGVNAWIDRLRPEDLPLEYRLLNVAPGRWRPAHTLYLLQRMNWTLSYGRQSLMRQTVAAQVGGAAAEALLSARSPIQEPIQPNGLGRPRFDFAPLPPPDAREHTTASARVGWALEPILGSNSWAVTPTRTQRGYAILAGDPHLELTLPSIWYEIHLVVPGTVDVYGVTIPGAPGVIIGFNRDVAWSFTNTEADVMDYYRETVDDSLHPTATLLDDEWVPVTQRVETYTDPRGHAITSDTFFTSHRGPLRRIEDAWLSLRWTALEPSRTMQALLDGARAQTADQWLARMERFDVPPQNLLVADRAGTIAIRSTGKFPLRPGNNGGWVFDGTSSASDWTGFWPVDRMPAAHNPAQGYLASANQQPLDPAVDSTYLGSDWREPWRALRINQLLRERKDWTPEGMARLQTDPGSARADFFVPFFLAVVHRLHPDSTDPDLREGGRMLAEWDRRYTRSTTQAVVFELAMEEVAARVWDEMDDASGERVFTPSSTVLAALMTDSASIWWDDRGTPMMENRDSILAQSLRAAVRTATNRYGDAASGAWRWDRVRTMHVNHLLRIPALSARSVVNTGGTATLSPMGAGGTHGASWRMVVELGPEVRAWTTYPGGQSGNPASRLYDNRLARWSAGELDPVAIPRAPRDLPLDSVLARLAIRRAR